MSSNKNVQDTHISLQIKILHGNLISIASAMNRPQRDAAMIKEAGIPLDRALFPLLVGIEKLGPIGVVDMADRVGRDYTTVSRQVAKLEELGLVQRESSDADRRIRMASITVKGKAMTDLVDAARERMGRKIFASWEQTEMDEFVRLMSKFANALDKLDEH